MATDSSQLVRMRGAMSHPRPIHSIAGASTSGSIAKTVNGWLPASGCPRTRPAHSPANALNSNDPATKSCGYRGQKTPSEAIATLIQHPAKAISAGTGPMNSAAVRVPAAAIPAPANAARRPRKASAQANTASNKPAAMSVPAKLTHGPIKEPKTRQRYQAAGPAE